MCPSPYGAPLGEFPLSMSKQLGDKGGKTYGEAKDPNSLEGVRSSGAWISPRNALSIRRSAPVPRSLVRFLLPTDREVYTILRAPHKYKDSREQFEMRTHKRLIDIINPTPQTVDSLMRLDLPSGVDIEIKL